MTQKNIDIVYFYEHVARELDVACAVASLLRTRYGLSIEIIQWPYGYHRVAALHRPRVVVLPFCYTSSSFSRCLLDWREATFFNLSWEQLFYEGNRIAKAPRGQFACQNVIHHAWSDLYADFLQRNSVTRQHIYVNGQPAYALYEEPYRRYFKQRSDLASTYGLNAERRWLFFPENYNWAFYSEATLQRFVNFGQSPEDVEIMREFCRSSLKEVIKWCDAAADDESIEIIVRPRPATTLEEFRSVALKILPRASKRLHLIKDETVREWILASDVVVSSHSTSLIEASIAGKAAYMLEPFPIPRPLSVEWHRLVPHIKSRVEFLDVCASNPKQEVSRPLAVWARSAMMARGDTIRNLAHYLSGLCRNEIPPPPATTRKGAVEHWGLGIPSWLLFELLRLAFKRRRQRPFRSIEPDLVMDVISQVDIEARISRWDSILA